MPLPAQNYIKSVFGAKIIVLLFIPDRINFDGLPKPTSCWLLPSRTVAVGPQTNVDFSFVVVCYHIS